MYRKDMVDTIQAVLLIIMTLSASILMLSASYICVTYQAQSYPDSYQVNLISRCATSEID